MSCVALVLSLLGADLATTRHIDVDEAVDYVMLHHPAAQGARARLEGSRASVRQVRGHMLPSLHVSDAQSWYRSSFTLPPALFSETQGGSSPLTGFPNALQVNIFSVSAAQPVLGLLRLWQNKTAADEAANATEEEARATEQTLRAQVQTAFLRLFEARALADTAAASERDLQEQVAVAQKKVEVGALTTADVLRLQVAAANARQQALVAHAQELTQRATLLEMLDLEDDPAVLFVEPEALQRVGLPPSLPQAREQALAQRPELKSVRLQAHAAGHHARAETFALLPELNLQASWMHIAADTLGERHLRLGVSNGSVGVTASWAVWEWGASWYARQQAVAQADAAAAALQSARKGVSVEVASRHAEALAMASAVDVALAQVASAEEAFRVTTALNAAGSATTTDLLDAEAALTGARMSLVHARYELAVAHVALRRAIGAP